MRAHTHTHTLKICVRWFVNSAKAFHSRGSFFYYIDPLKNDQFNHQPLYFIYSQTQNHKIDLTGGDEPRILITNIQSFSSTCTKS